MKTRHSSLGVIAVVVAFSALLRSAGQAHGEKPEVDNGKRMGSAPLGKPVADTKAPLTFGGVNDNGRIWQNLRGAVDEARLYGRALSDEEIEALYRPVTTVHEIPKRVSQIWEPSVPFPSSTEAPLLKGVEFHIIKSHEPQVDGYKWLHGATIVRHKNTWFMTWGHNKGRENTLGEVAQGRRSTDDFATLTPVEMIAPGTPTDANSHGVTLSLNGELWGFFGLSKGSRKGNRAEAYKLNETTDKWESQGVVMDKGFWPYTEPKRMDNGNYITAGFRMNVENGSPPAVAISNGDNMLDWTVVPIPKPAGLDSMWGESTVIVRGSNLVCIVRNHGSDAGAYVSASDDYGLTWTPVERSNMRMVASKPYAGTLSTGRDYLICTTTSNSGNTRRPLTIALTDPGGGQFNKVYRIRDGVRPGEGKTTEAGLAYPYAVEHDRSLYVVYSVGRPGNHKNALELAIIPLSSLESAEQDQPVVPRPQASFEDRIKAAKEQWRRTLWYPDRKHYLLGRYLPDELLAGMEVPNE